MVRIVLSLPEPRKTAKWQDSSRSRLRGTLLLEVMTVIQILAMIKDIFAMITNTLKPPSAIQIKGSMGMSSQIMLCVVDWKGQRSIARRSSARPAQGLLCLPESHRRAFFLRLRSQLNFSGPELTMAATIVTVDGEMIDGLRRAINDCADRGLQHASKWYARFSRYLASVLIHVRRAAELLAAISPAKRRARQDLSFTSSTPARSSSADTSLPRVSFATPHPHGPLAGALDSRVSAEELALELDEEDVLSAGMATFRCREFARAAHTLSACSSSRGRFLWLYSQYLVSHIIDLPSGDSVR